MVSDRGTGNYVQASNIAVVGKYAMIGINYQGVSFSFRCGKGVRIEVRRGRGRGRGRAARRSILRENPKHCPGGAGAYTDCIYTAGWGDFRPGCGNDEQRVAAACPGTATGCGRIKVNWRVS